MYNMLFGESSNAEKLLSLLGLTRDNFYRYRDCYLSEDKLIAVYTRGGGDNRECYEDDCDFGDSCVVAIQNKLREHPLYDHDDDDDFDNTYATFYFRLPSEVDLTNIAPEVVRNEQWLSFLGMLSNTKGGNE